MAQKTCSSSSSSIQTWSWDVFVSFCGKDTRLSFTDHLFAALYRNGIRTFRDDREMERGEAIWPELEKAIVTSRIAVIVFSRNYAASSWCLKELEKIMECRRSLKQIVLPVFYDVDPSDARNQKGSLEKAFASHEERFGLDKVRRWRAALTEAANLCGEDLQNVAHRFESTFMEEIIKDIFNKLDLAYFRVATYPVGIESRLQDLNRLLSRDSGDVCMVGILGIGGIGKTTMAKAVYNLLHSEFEESCFLGDVRETAKQPDGLIKLQKKILSSVQVNDGRKISHVDQGTMVIKDRVWSKRVLLVLDDVDHQEQLDKLAVRRNYFQPGSRIIITTRNESLLNLFEVDERYMPPKLNHHESLLLFSWHAFRKDQPNEDFEELSKEVIGYAEGLPLALEVLGSLLSDKKKSEWQSALQRLKVTIPCKIQEKLRVSFDSLSDEQQELFLDIAFFFDGMDKNYTIEILKDSNLFPEIEVAVLVNRCLVTIDNSNKLRMHNLLRDMGREIVRREFRKEPGKRSRLCIQEDVLDVLKKNTGTVAVEGIVLNLHRSNEEQVNSEAFAKMNRLRVLQLNYMGLSGSFHCPSKSLRWLQWYGFPLRSLPSDLYMENLVVIDMPHSRLKEIWKGTKILKKLKFLNLSHSYHLKRTPNFAGMTSLEELLLNDCTSLVEVHQSIECLQKLVVLDLNNCSKLRNLPPGICKLKSLKYLTVSGCSKLDMVLDSEGSPSKSWYSLFSSWADPLRSPASISSLISLQDFSSIRKLFLQESNLAHLPDDLGCLVSLVGLNLSGNNFSSLPASISLLVKLKYLNLNRCRRLQSIPELPISLEALYANNCKSLKRLSIGSKCPSSPELRFLNCSKQFKNNFACDLKKSIVHYKELSTLGDFNVFLHGADDVPDLFNYQHSGSVLSFVVPPLENQKLRGCFLCVSFASLNRDIHGFSVVCEFSNITKKLEERYYEMNPLVITGEDFMWFNYIPLPYLDFQLEVGDEVEYLITVKDNYQVKKLGVNLIYEDDQKDYQSCDQAIIQYASPPDEADALDEDASADQAVTYHKKIHPSCIQVKFCASICILCLCAFLFVYLYVS